MPLSPDDQTGAPSLYDMIEGTWTQLDALAIHLYGNSPAHLREALAQNRALLSVYQQRADQLSLKAASLANVAPGAPAASGNHRNEP